MEAKTLMKKAPIDWRKAIERLHTDERDEMRRKLEAISERAGMLAAYIDERHGYGCGDQGHDKAVKEMNRAGRKIHMDVFGYNAFHDLSI